MDTLDLYTLIDKATKAKKTVNIHATLIRFFDRMMNESGITDPEKLQRLAQLRAKIDIELKDF